MRICGDSKWEPLANPRYPADAAQAKRAENAPGEGRNNNTLSHHRAGVPAVEAVGGAFEHGGEDAPIEAW